MTRVSTQQNMVKVSTLSIVGISIISLIALCNSNCPKKFLGIEGHTACISRSPDYLSGGVTYEDARIIVNLHNKYRGEVHPPACMMFKLYWNDELAFLAQKWAENCKFEHDKSMRRYIPGSYHVGQNLANGNGGWTSYIDAWHDEKDNFTYGGSKNDIKLVGNYTQMIWGKSVLIGCGYAKCKNINLYVCNYGPSGNNGKINRPYEQCKTVSHLRDCEGKVCKNGGTFHRHQCKCICMTSPHITGTLCEMNCTIYDRPRLCRDTYQHKHCKHPQVLYECPWMCNVCPYASRSVSFKYSATRLLVLAVLFLVLMM